MKEERFMLINKIRYAFIFVSVILLLAGNVCASDEQLLFSNVPPTAMLLLDNSGSMNFPAAGDKMCTDNSSACNNYDNSTTNLYVPASYNSNGTIYCPSAHPFACVGQLQQSDTYFSSSVTCPDPIHATSGSLPNGKYDCSKLAIAKSAIFQTLDANYAQEVAASQTPQILSGIVGSDDSMLNVIMGYMNYYNAGTSSPYGISVQQNFGTVSSPRKYSSIYCGSGSSTGYSCFQTTNLSKNASTYVSSADASGATPLAFALSNVLGNSNTTAKSTIDTYRSSDTFSACRNNYVILITDGADTLACPNVPAGSNACTDSSGYTGQCGSGFEDYVHDYPRRRATVASTYNLAQDNIKTFVIGFGGMSQNLMNTLNWAAYYGDPKDWDSTVVPPPPNMTSLNIP